MRFVWASVNTAVTLRSTETDQNGRTQNRLEEMILVRLTANSDAVRLEGERTPPLDTPLLSASLSPIQED